MHIYLIRHGQKHSHPGDPGLTDLGVKQATQTGQYLSQFPISKIIASPFKRTIQTALHIGQVLGLEHSLHQNLIERMSWDDKNVTRNQFLNEWIKATNDRQYTPLYGSSSFQTGRKVEEVVSNLLGENRGKHVALVTHGGAIIDYLRNIFGDAKVEQLRTKYDEGEDYQMFNCSISKVVMDGADKNNATENNKPTLALLNFVDHLVERSE